MFNAAQPASPRCILKFGIFINIACLAAMALLFGAMGAAAMTWPPGYDLEVTRSYEHEGDNIPLGEPVTATWSISLPPASSLSGLFFTENYPAWLDVANASATLNGEALTIFHEIGTIGDNLPGLIPHRILFWDPSKPWLDIVIDSNDVLLVEYTVTSQSSGIVHTHNNHWSGTLHSGGERVVGGWDERAPFLDFGSTPVFVDEFRVLDAEDHLTLSWTFSVRGDTEIVCLLRAENDDVQQAKTLHTWDRPTPGYYSYDDHAVETAREYTYWLAAMDKTGVLDHLLASARGRLARPSVARFHAAFPNPFNPHTQLSFTLLREQRLELAIFDDRGRRLRNLAEGVWSAGQHELSWDGRDDRGNTLPSGVYFARLILEEQPSQVQKLTLLR